MPKLLSLTFLTSAWFAAGLLSQQPLTAQSTSTPPTPPPQAAGYAPVFDEEFNTLNISPDGTGVYTWYPGLYFQHDTYSSTKMSVSNGVLDLHWDNSQLQTSTEIETCSYDGTTSCPTYRYGYFEARMKWDGNTQGAFPAFWTNSQEAVKGDVETAELDFFEGQGAINPQYYFGTINYWFEFTAQLGPALSNSYYPPSNNFPVPAGTDYTQWHTYGVLWTPTQVTWYLDNVAVGSVLPYPVFETQDLFLILSMHAGSFANPTLNVSVPLNLYVDWVHVFQTPATVTLPGI